MRRETKKGNFGETLRREREMRGVSLEEVASATRISTRNLEALENEQWDQLPGGVFNRGFIRSISRYLGLDEEVLVAEYVVATDDQPQMAVWATKEDLKKRSFAGWILGLLVIALLGAAGFFLWRDWPLLASALRGASASSAASPAQTAPAAQQPRANPAPSAAVDPPAVAQPETLELKVDAVRATTVRIVADGKTLLDGRMDARDSRKFTAKERFEISAGDSFALLMELNGQAVPPIGQPGQPGRLTLTHNDLKKPEGSH